MNLPTEGIDFYLQQLAELDRGEVELVVAPPFPYLAQVCAKWPAVAAQNCSDRESGAFTGEVSAPMLRELGVRFVIVGHSERRTLFGEDDDTVSRKLKAAAGTGLVPILCVGEDEATRKRGQTNSVLTRQLDAALSGFSDRAALIAYEPVWAIGTGLNATPRQAAEAHGFIRKRLAALGIDQDRAVLYGGSVSPENAGELAAEEQIDGFLVGGSSLEPSKFRGIYERMIPAR